LLAFAYYRISTIAGHVSRIPIHPVLRPAVYSSFISFTGINPTEIPESLSSYPTLSALFSRTLDPSLRPIAASSLVSPADGKIVHIVSNSSPSHTVTIKNTQYSLSELINKKSDESWNAIVVYLAPKNYHRFHAPIQLNQQRISYFGGNLMSVDPWFVKRVPGLLTLNERVVMHADTELGWLSYVAVGATCVGSIFFGGSDIPVGGAKGWRDVEIDDSASRLGKGDEVGGFRMGSTVVLVWSGEGEFVVKEGDEIKVGEGVWTKRE
jgi:phosphatidylserine decarboxylase